MIKSIRKYLSFSLPIKWALFIFLLVLNCIAWAVFFFNVPYASLQSFSGTFVGSFLGFLIALLLDRRNEERLESKKNTFEKEDLKKAINLIVAEMLLNKKLAEDIGKYFRAITSIASQDFKSRDKDYLFYRLQLSSKEAVWKKILEGINETGLVFKVGMLYEDFAYLNNLLHQLCAYMSSFHALRTGRIIEDYKMAITNSPWEIQIINKLDSVSEECIRMIKSLTDFRESI